MGKLYIVGIGPGDEKTLTGAARQALDACDCICGYTLYVELLRTCTRTNRATPPA